MGRSSTNPSDRSLSAMRRMADCGRDLVADAVILVVVDRRGRNRGAGKWIRGRWLWRWQGGGLDGRKRWKVEG